MAIYAYKRLNKKPHAFWDKQPVSRNYNKAGIISSKRLDSVKIDTCQLVNFNMTDPKINKQVVEFIRHHFLKGYQYSLTFLQWSISKDSKDLLALVNRSPRQLIGTIACRPIHLTFGSEMIKTGYVDYLAVHSDFRGKRLATTLISKLVDTNPLDCFLFKIESTLLPFDYLCKFRYYVLNLSSYREVIYPRPEVEWHPVTTSNINLCYNYYEQMSQAFKMYQTYSPDDFREWFLPREEIVYSFVRIRDGMAIAFASFFQNRVGGSYWGKNKTVTTVELTVLLSDDVTLDLKHLITFIIKIGAEYLVTTNLGKNRIFIDRLPFIPAKRCYLQMYNYGTLNIYSPNDILLNLP